MSILNYKLLLKVVIGEQWEWVRLIINSTRVYEISTCTLYLFVFKLITYSIIYPILIIIVNNYIVKLANLLYSVNYIYIVSYYIPGTLFCFILAWVSVCAHTHEWNVSVTEETSVDACRRMLSMRVGNCYRCVSVTADPQRLLLPPFDTSLVYAVTFHTIIPTCP